MLQMNANFPTPKEPLVQGQIGQVVSCPRTSIEVSGALGEYNWLPYIPGHVAVTELADAPLITGRMSGCFIVVYRNNDPGSRFFKLPFVAHIGTVNSINTDETIAAKAAWVNFVRTLDPKNSIIVSYKPTSDNNLPAADVNATFSSSTIADGTPCFYALIKNGVPGKFNGVDIYTLLCRDVGGRITVKKILNANPDKVPF